MKIFPKCGENNKNPRYSRSWFWHVGVNVAQLLSCSRSSNCRLISLNYHEDPSLTGCVRGVKEAASKTNKAVNSISSVVMWSIMAPQRVLVLTFQCLL